jgi:hypothetical protein
MHELRGELLVLCLKLNAGEGIGEKWKGQIIGDLIWQAKEFIHIYSLFLFARLYAKRY